MHTCKRAFRRIICAIAVTVCLFLAWCIYHCYVDAELSIAEYSVMCNVTEPIRVVHLSDLHSVELGNGNEHLIGAVAEQKPDLIFMTGDMLNRDDPTAVVACSLVRELRKIAPVYYGYGNHEVSWEENWNKDLAPLIEAAGAVVLNKNYLDVEIKGTQARIGGYMGYYGSPHMHTANSNQVQSDLDFDNDFEDTDRLKLLLNHIPTQWIDWDNVYTYPVDLVFSGHYHGGMVQLPLINRGLYAPYAGLFPFFTKGVYHGSKATCILSAGLGSEYLIPRINNPPEVVVVLLEPS